MPVIQSLLFHVPSWLLCSLMILLYVGVSVAGLLFIRKYYPHHKCKLHNDVAGFIFATLGVIYAVLLAFIVVVVWQDFDRAQDATSTEAACITGLYRDSTPFPTEFRATLKSKLTEYVKAIIDDEWQTMAKGRRSVKAHETLEELWKLYGGFQPKGETQRVFFEESVRKLNQAAEARRQRIVYSGSGINSLLYFVLFVGSVITISFTLLFGTENIVPHLIMVASLAAMIAITLFIIISLDYPFTGDICVSTDVFTNTLETLTRP
jgi:hypothetical protein